MRKLIIIRGLPGSGKSTFANKLIKMYRSEGKSVAHWENDMFFYDSEGNYNYDKKLAYTAIKWCFNHVKKDMLDKDVVIVSNTFINKADFVEYLELAESLGMQATVYRCNNNYGSIHNVPQEIIDKMRDRFKNFKGEIIV